MTDLSIIVTTHGEGELLVASVTSAFEAVQLLEQTHEVSVEKIVVMDRPTQSTIDAVDVCAAQQDIQVHKCDYGDQGKVRNHIVGIAQGRYVAFLDGDDLWSENWLLTAYEMSRSHAGPLVIYPEFNWFFEGSNNILCQVDSDSEFFDQEALRSVNLWDALCFCPRQVYLDTPFPPRRISDGFAFEDWNWNRRIMELGVTQKIAPDTIIFKRRRIGSQGAQAAKRGVMAEPTRSVYYDFFQ